MKLDFGGEIWFWRGPSPFHFVTVPPAASDQIREVSPQVSYGWGVIPVRARIGATQWATSLFPKDGGYLVPVKASVRTSEAVGVGDVVRVTLEIDVSA